MQQVNAALCPCTLSYTPGTVADAHWLLSPSTVLESLETQGSKSLLPLLEDLMHSFLLPVSNYTVTVLKVISENVVSEMTLSVDRLAEAKHILSLFQPLLQLFN